MNSCLQYQSCSFTQKDSTKGVFLYFALEELLETYLELIPRTELSCKNIYQLEATIFVKKLWHGY